MIVHPCDRKGASALYRLIWPSQELQRQGCDVEIYHDRPYQAWILNTPHFGEQVVGIDGDVEGDVVVFQRPLERTWYELMGHLQDRGIAVVVELDDGFHCLPPHNPVYKDVDPIANPHRNYQWLERACERADWVTCTTNALAQHYGGHGRVTVIPNYMPRSYTEIQRPDIGEPPVIGWSGSVRTHRGDLRVTQGAIVKAVDVTGGRLHILGTGQGVADQLGTDRFEAMGECPIEEYPYQMAKFDVGIVPLKLTRFNHAKSALKVSEWASLGVPVIASPTEANTSAARLGLCTLAGTYEEWLTEAMLLLTDKEWREERGTKARKVVKDQLVLEDNAYKWMEAWKNAYNFRNGRFGDTSEDRSDRNRPLVSDLLGS